MACRENKKFIVGSFQKARRCGVKSSGTDEIGLEMLLVQLKVRPPLSNVSIHYSTLIEHCCLIPMTTECYKYLGEHRLFDTQTCFTIALSILFSVSCSKPYVASNRVFAYGPLRTTFGFCLIVNDTGKSMKDLHYSTHIVSLILRCHVRSQDAGMVFESV